jgi:predicted HicB family RNase H-like nuclease
MRYKGYLGTVEYDADAKILRGEVSGLRDVVTFQADSVTGIEKAFRDSVNDYLAFCQQRGEKPEKPCSGQFVVRVGSKLHRELTAIAKSTGQSLNSIVKEYLEHQIKQTMAGASSEHQPRRRKSA